MTPCQRFEHGDLYQGDALSVLRTLPEASVQCCVTSPPYWGLRDYGVAGQIGMEATPEEYVTHLVAVFDEVKRVLRADGTLWLNIGDSYAGSWGNYGGQNRGYGKQRPIVTGSLPTPAWDNLAGYRPAASRSLNGIKPKDLVGIPWMLAFALRANGWYLRSDIIWAKPNPMPESVKDRPTRSHEYLFLLSKSERYYYDSEAIKEPASGDPHAQRNRWDTKDYAIPGQKPQKRTDRDKVATKFHPRREVDTRGGGQAGGVIVWSPWVRNRRSVWTVPTKGFPGAHFATFPPDLVAPCILAGRFMGATVLDPFFGSGTVGEVAALYRRKWIGIELNPDYCAMAARRVEGRPVVKNDAPAPLLALLGGV